MKKNKNSPLPLIILAASLVLKLCLFYIKNPNYGYDEIITTAISQQPITQLINSVQAEPHPPGFYLMLKALPVNHPTQTKIILSIISYTLTLITLIIAQKTKIVSKYKLSLGLSLFLSSFTFFYISSEVKQYAIALPLFLLGTISFINTVKNKKIILKWLLLSHLLLSTLLFFEYIPYALLLIIISATTILFYRQTKTIAPLIFQIMLFTSYLTLFGYQQILNFISYPRFILSGNISLIKTLSTHFSGSIPPNAATDFMLIITITLISLVINKKHSLINKIIFLMTIILISLGYATRTLIAVRYSFFPLLLINLIAGWGLSELSTKIKYLVVSLAFLNAATGFIIHNKSGQLFQALSQKLNSIPQNQQPTGLICDNQLFPLVLSLHYPLKPNIKPINILKPNISYNTKTINKNQLTLDSISILNQLSQQEIINKINLTRLSQFIYFSSSPNTRSYEFDPNKKILKALNKLCLKKEITPYNNGSFIFLFQQCSPNKI